MESSDATAKAIEQLYCLYYQPVLHYLERLIQQHQSAEDLCQETFLKVFKYRDQLREVACVRGWLYRIATNTAYDYLRRQRCIAFTGLPEEATWIADTPMETRWDDAEPVWDALRRMSAHYLSHSCCRVLADTRSTISRRPWAAARRVPKHAFIGGASTFASTTLLDMSHHDQYMSFAH